MSHQAGALKRWLPDGGATEPVQTLRLLFWLRVLAIASQAVVIGFVHYGLGVTLPLAPLAATLFGLAAWNVFAGIRVRRSTTTRREEVALNLVVDVVAFTSVIYFTGGSTNPFVSLYLLPISLAAASLPAVYGWTIAGVCAAGYSFLLLRHVPLPSVDQRFGGDFDLHVAGMWVNFLVAGVLIVFFVGRIARVLRRRDQQLADMREEALRDRQLVELGTLAAGAAHELNTPLSTLLLLVEELAETVSDGAGRPRLDSMNEQIATISRRLTRLARDVGAERSESARCMRLERFVEDLVQGWRATHPATRLTVDYDLEEPDMDIVAESTIELAICNVLDNASQAIAAEAGEIDVIVSCRGEQLTITVADNGPGLSAAIERDVGDRIVSTKQGGLGIGLLLSRASLERFGGGLQLRNRPSGGVEARIDVPLRGLLAHAG
ncbi:MAG TPA: ATP-binding protein [Woeseiaceae bacterium]|nr:ATP-binding protein [Woeseiaceae bacterium]